MERLYQWHYNRLFGPKASGDRKSVPEFWRDTILRAFAARQLRWTRKHRLQLNEDGTIENLPLKASWRWGPHREGPEFNGLFQPQHLTLSVVVPRDEVHITVQSIIDNNRDNSPYILTPKDVNPAQISYAKLQQIIAATDNSPYSPSTHELSYLHPDLATHFVEITNNETLVDALRHCQEYMNEMVAVFMIPRGTESKTKTFTTSTENIAVLPEPQKIEKKKETMLNNVQS
ncbi:unnamed protein product [Alternaria burnsii]|nr:unnamed protein product [Alternaria burnsii]